MEQNSQDRRVRRTRALLRQSLTELMKEKNIRDISVKELTQRADVNRGTFYSHYQDIYDMVRQLEDELFEEFNQVISAYPAEAVQREGVYPIVRDVFAFVRRNADLCATLLGDGRDSTFLERLRAAVHQKVAAEWSALYDLRSEALWEYILAFLVGGMVNIIQKWASGGWKQTPEELAGLSNHLIWEGMSGLQGAKE